MHKFQRYIRWKPFQLKFELQWKTSVSKKYQEKKLDKKREELMNSITCFNKYLIIHQLGCEQKFLVKRNKKKLPTDSWERVNEHM